MRFLLIALLAAAMHAPQDQTGTIEGIVTRARTAFPISGVEVKVSTDGAFTSVTVTDGSGRFVIRDVPPGRARLEIRKDAYMFGLPPTPNPFLQMTVVVDPGKHLQLPIPATPASAIRGRVVDGDGKGIEGLPIGFFLQRKDAQGRQQLVQMMGAVQTDVEGEYRHGMLSPGDYVVRATLDRPNAPTLMVYYPATTDVSLAAPAVLGEGAEVTADIRITSALDEGTHKITGRVLPLPGKSKPSSVALILKMRDASSSPAYSAADEQTGEFEIHGVRQGIYDLFASANIDDKEYLAKVPIEIRGRDAEKVELVLRPGMDIHGRLVIDDDAKGLQFARTGAGTVKITLNRKDGLFSNSIYKPDIDAIGTAFTFHDVLEGDYDISVTFVAEGASSLFTYTNENGILVSGRAPSPDLYVADVRATGRSVFDNGFQVGTDPVDAMEVVVGTNGGSIAGTVLASGTNRPVVSTVILVPEFLRRSNTSLSRRIPVSPSSNGQFQLRGLTPGNYKIYAVPSGNEYFSYLSPEFVAQYEYRATSVTVQKGIPLNGIQLPLLPLVK